MPKDANGTVPVSKSQRNKAARIAKLAKQGGKSYGGKCSRCGQESSSSTPGKAHLGCPEDGSLFGFELSYRLRAPFLRKWMGPNGEGMWLSKEDYTRFESEVDSFLLSVRNFSTENNRWENAYGEPINFLTWEVLEEIPESSSNITPEGMSLAVDWQASGNADRALETACQPGAEEAGLITAQAA